MRRLLVGLLGCGGLLIAVGSAVADEAEVFNRLDADEDGQVTAEEAGAEHGRLFKRLVRTSDKNDDGKLSREEFVAGTTKKPDAADGPAANQFQDGQRPRQFGFEQILSRFDKDGDKKISKEEAPERMRENFDRVDANSDGFIDEPEFRRIAAVLGGRDNPQNKPDAAQIAQMAERIFNERDANEDGRVSIDEVPEDRREGFREMLKQFDVTPEKGITKEQFTKVLTQRLAQGRPNTDRPQGGAIAGAILQRLKQADANNDGKLSREEAPERMRPFFDRLDGNSDGFLDEAEVRAILKRRQDAPRNDRERPQPRRKRPAAE